MDNYYKMILEECAKDCEYFDKKVDSASQSVKETNKEVISQSGGETNEIKSIVHKKNKRRIQSSLSADKTQSRSLIVTDSELQELIR
ncbi:1460_t:CDS:2 [Funneliformis mosseae]|uniref:1460_t:CDS:1 n=1 Tax=Funneliformis mosseae TaxID=27381 RepID=A0A9N9DK07_FUNMO|nr:1460_t:CDS:2 [Funneliformis mosseae]